MRSILFDIASRGSLAVFGAAVVAFALLYSAFAATGWWLTKTLFPALKLGAVIDSRPLRQGQIANEIRRSSVSIAVFGIYAVLTVEAFRAGLVDVKWEAPAGEIVSGILILILWNETHFWLCHRMLHTRWLYRHVHRIHHESVVPTPFSVFSFHWAEAALLGSVMITAMFLKTFSVWALFSLPVFSLLFNTIGHWNYNLLAGTRLPSASVEHARHHRLVAGNYGFYSSAWDRLFRTRLRESA